MFGMWVMSKENLQPTQKIDYVRMRVTNSQLYTAESDKLYTAESDKLYTAESEKLYTAESDKLYTAQLYTAESEKEEKAENVAAAVIVTAPSCTFGVWDYTGLVFKTFVSLNARLESN